MTILGWIASVVASGAALAGAWRLILGVARAARKVGHFLDDWSGEPARPGVEARPGVIEQLADHGARLAEVERQFKPNGGHSAKDQLNRIERVITTDGEGV